MKRIHENIAKATAKGEKHTSYGLYSVGDQYGPGWQKMVKPMPLILSLIDDVFPLSYRQRHYSNPVNLRGLARQIYDTLSADGFAIVITERSFELSW